MSYDGAIPLSEAAMRDLIHDYRRSGDVENAYSISLELLRRELVSDPETICAIAIAARKYGDTTLLLRMLAMIRTMDGVDPNRVLDVEREWMQLLAKSNHHAAAAKYAAKINDMRTDANQRVVDKIADARRLLYARKFPDALIAITEAQAALVKAGATSRISPHHTEDLAWWMLISACLARDTELAQISVHWLLELSENTATRPTRLAFATKFERILLRHPLTARIRSYIMARLILRYDKRH